MEEKNVDRFSTLSPPVFALWAKSGEEKGHTLLAHMLDVSAVAEAILELEPESTRRSLSAQFGLSTDAIPRWFGALVGLHDVGKAIPGFQALWPLGQAHAERHGLTFTDLSRRHKRHDLASVAILEQWLPIETGAGFLWCEQVAGAVGAHHGYPPSVREVDHGLSDHEDPTWYKARLNLLEVYWRVLSPPGGIIVDELALPAINWLAGLTSIADWIGSNAEWFPLGERYDNLLDYYQHARSLAHQALSTIGWRNFAPLLTEPVPLDQQLGLILSADQPVSLRELQSHGIALLQESKGPALLLVEAPMGEGKTELAFLAHLHLQRTRGHRGFYIALPTQATGNALYARACQFVRAFSHGEELELQLVHAGAAQQEKIAMLHQVWGQEDKRLEGVEAARWFSQRKRPLIAPYGVGTIDQALFSVLNVKHHFVRLWGLANRVVVLDEVHAYDTYTEGLIEVLLHWLKELGCSVILMSATLPTQRRDALLRAWQVDPISLPPLVYPRLILADDRGLDWDDQMISRTLAPIKLVGCGTTPEELVEVALSALQEGGCGAIIVNTVERAQQIFTLLKAQLSDGLTLLLFHARFPVDDRARREAAVLSTFGKEGRRPAHALLVATQVVEQSLDIDFDFLISDLAPIDLLLQRVGRLHRHSRPKRPTSHDQPVLTVAGLSSDGLPDLTATRWRFVYDSYLLAMTWAQLLDVANLQMPLDIDRLVQAVYGDSELPASVDEALRQYIEEDSYAEHLADLQCKRQQACNIAIRADADPALAYSNKPRGHEQGEGQDIGIVNCTRLGKPSVIVIPLYVSGKDVTLMPGGESFDLNAPLSAGLTCQLSARRLSLSNQRLVRAIKLQPEYRAFAESPLLRYSYPLLLDDLGNATLDSELSITLDSELGLIYKN